MQDNRIVISGSSGLIGRALIASFESDGIAVTRLVRHAVHGPGEVRWYPGVETLNPAVLKDAEAVINLNGASIGRLPWSRKYRKSLLESRTGPTRTIADALRQLGTDAPIFVSASAVGYYGNRPGEALNEQSGSGETFLATLCEEWESTALEAGAGVRVCLLRTAPLLHPLSVLKPLIGLTKLGVSGPLGTGTQVWPWISLEDEVRAIRHIVASKIEGPVNVTGPNPASANDIGRELARQLKRPFLVPVPSWALRLAIGRDAADSLLLADANVTPRVLTDSGFQFINPTIDTAIASALRN